MMMMMMIIITGNCPDDGLVVNITYPQKGAVSELREGVLSHDIEHPARIESWRESNNNNNNNNNNTDQFT